MAYHHYVDCGRLPGDIHDLDMAEYLRIHLWRASRSAMGQAPRQATIDEFI